jgi:hypothetical protein
MSRIGHLARAARAEISRDPGGSPACTGRGPRLASVIARNALWAASIAILLCGCVVTNPVEFKDEVDVPPLILDDPSLPNGSIIKFEKIEGNVEGPKEIFIDLQVRDDNLEQRLYVRTRITKGDSSVILSSCPDAELARQGQALSVYTLPIPQASLNPGECHKVEIAVSGGFTGCYSKNDELQRDRFDWVKDPDDIARATYWVWEVGNDLLADPVRAQTLIKSCNKPVEYRIPTVMAP